jgi:hypothetical protein
MPVSVDGSISEGTNLIKQQQYHAAIAMLEKISQENNSDRAKKFSEKAMAHLSADPYQALNLPKRSSRKDVKKTYRKLALKYHPDKNKYTADLFKVISNAYEKLKDKPTPKKGQAFTNPEPPPRRKSRSSGRENTSNTSNNNHHYEKKKKNPHPTIHLLLLHADLSTTQNIIIQTMDGHRNHHQRLKTPHHFFAQPMKHAHLAPPRSMIIIIVKSHRHIHVHHGETNKNHQHMMINQKVQGQDTLTKVIIIIRICQIAREVGMKRPKRKQSKNALKQNNG